MKYDGLKCMRKCVEERMVASGKSLLGIQGKESRYYQ